MDNGKYSYRFDGYAMKKAKLHVIVGIGTLEVENLEIKGTHFSSLTKLEESDSALVHSHFLVEGNAKFVKAEQSWSVELRFAEQNAPANRNAQSLIGQFRAVEAGQGRYWIISTGAESNMGAGPQLANEVVHGEVLRIG